MNDTPKEIENRINQMIAKRSPDERLQMAGSMFDAAKELMIAGIRREKPALNQAQIKGQLFSRLYSDCFTEAEIKKIAKHIPDMQID